VWGVDSDESDACSSEAFAGGAVVDWPAVAAGPGVDAPPVAALRSRALTDEGSAEPVAPLTKRTKLSAAGAPRGSSAWRYTEVDFVQAAKWLQDSGLSCAGVRPARLLELGQPFEGIVFKELAGTFLPSFLSFGLSFFLSSFLPFCLSAFLPFCLSRGYR